MTTQKINMFDAFLIKEGQDGKSEWVKIGVAFQNRDNSINVLLDAMPRDGRFQLRPRKKIDHIK